VPCFYLPASMFARIYGLHIQHLQISGYKYTYIYIIINRGMQPRCKAQIQKGVGAVGIVNMNNMNTRQEQILTDTPIPCCCWVDTNADIATAKQEEKTIFELFTYRLFGKLWCTNCLVNKDL
jgi:hypothetical protein